MFGQAGGFSSSIDLSSLNGSNGFVLNGVDSYDESGSSVSGAGDVNGDGFDDLIIGAFRAAESYVVFGQAGGFSRSIDLSSLNGSNGFVLNGSDEPVSNAGDVNGDGFDDLIIGEPLASPNGDFRAGESYVVFGKAGGFSSGIDLSSSFLNGSNGFVLNGIDSLDYSGRSVSSAGDVNGDGFDDLIIGATGASPNGNFRAGESYVVFGQAGGFSSSIDLSSLNGSNGFVLNGIDSYDQSGSSVSAAGDVNGDGFDDLIIGATGADPNGSYSGESYVVFGGRNFAASVELNHPNSQFTNVTENSPNGTFIALLKTEDVDQGDTHTYTLIDDAGGRFAIDQNNQLVVANGSLLDFETNTSAAWRK